MVKSTANYSEKSSINFISPACAKPLLAAVFFALIISILENKLKIYLKRFANSKQGCIFVLR